MSIRNEVRDGRSAEEDDGEPETTSVHYLASQYLADSSLSTDVSQFDFGSTATVNKSIILLPTRSEEWGVMDGGSFPVDILPSCQDMKTNAL